MKTEAVIGPGFAKIVRDGRTLCRINAYSLDAERASLAWQAIDHRVTPAISRDGACSWIVGEGWTEERAFGWFRAQCAAVIFEALIPARHA